jgi:hypothetical protein
MVVLEMPGLDDEPAPRASVTPRLEKPKPTLRSAGR